MIKLKYKILQQIGEGNFGKVFKGQNIKTGDYVAIKMENTNSTYKMLKHETIILNYLYNNSCKYIPTIFWYGVYLQNTSLVMTYYECSLFDYINKMSNSMTTQLYQDLIHRIMKMLLIIIQNIHSKTVIHRDIKLINFMIRGAQNTIHDIDIVLIDFGLATFCENNTIQNCHREHIIGTPKYISYNIHNGCDPHYRDDLISLGYIGLYMYFGELFWESKYIENNEIEKHTHNYNSPTHILYFINQQIKTNKEIHFITELLNKRMSSDKNIFIKNITNLLEYCYNLTYETSPSYINLIQIFS